MKRRTTLLLIALLALSLVSCNPVSRLTGKAKEKVKDKVKETAAAAVTSVVATVASLPTATAAAQAPAEGSSGPVEVDSLDTLESYRADWTTTMRLPGQDGGMTLEYKLEWVKDPPAQHVWMEMVTGSLAEVIWIEDKVWVKAGDRWVAGGDQDAEQAFEHFHDAFEVDDDMTLVGTETVNGMQTKHYVYDFESPAQNTKIHRETWVADERDLPAVPVRALYRMETTSALGAMATEIEAQIYDINEPIEITPPL